MWRTTPGRELLFLDDPAEVLLGNAQQILQLLDPVCTDVTGGMRRFGTLHQTNGFLVIGLGDVEGVFEGGVVDDCRFFFHLPSVVPIPG